MNKNGILLIVALIVFVAGGIWLFARDRGGVVSTDNSSGEAVAGNEITVNGKIVCLPYHIEVSGQACVKGIEAGGMVYALNSLAVDGRENSMEEGTRVTVTGVFQPAVRDKEANVFDYDGVLELRSLEVRQ